MSQKERMIQDMRKGHGVTPLDALTLYGCLSLSQRISELRKDGFIFIEQWVALPNQKRVKKFYLALEPLKEAS